MSSQDLVGYGFETKAVQAGQSASQWTNREIIPPVSLSTTYLQPSPGQPVTFEYSRSGNPTRRALETSLAALESGRYGRSSSGSLCAVIYDAMFLVSFVQTALVFSSGLAATHSLTQSVLKTGDHIVCCEDCYGGTGRLFRTSCAQNGIETTFVDTRDLEQIRQAMIPNRTKLVWIETPTNPTLRLTDIQAVAEMIKGLDWDVAYVVDSTFSSSYLQQPLALGADIVVHSLTKYMNGHSDVLMGAVITNSQTLFEKMSFFQNAIGAVPSPFDCFLVNRGLKTLALRMQAHSHNALKIARWLEQQDKVQQVIYPGLESHGQHELAKRQTPIGCSGVLCFRVKSSDEDAASKLVSSLKLFALAESLGGIESLCEIPALMTHASHPPDVLQRLAIDRNLIRLSVGVETAEDLIRDLRQALDQLPA